MAANLAKVAKVLGIIFSILLTGLGVLACFRQSTKMTFQLAEGTFDDRTSNVNGSIAIFVLGILVVAFGVIGVLGEFGLKFVLRRFGLFKYFWSKSIWYLFMAMCAFGLAGDVGFAVAMILGMHAIFLLLLTFIVGIRARASAKDGDLEDNYQPPEQPVALD
eukprot:TRINITY_DN2694_c0_g1_i1.p1 TRINITY_DN2694_c0_g1~~TRINITY_DN2694_c0_g1_i1.p1  ORF type:complete len:162 (-),score=24.43 TRINITY_DN2694_c0_g1_i1:58-543(-)